MATSYPASTRSFHEEARFQLACAACGAVGQPFEAHHIIKKQRLVKEGIVNVYDPDNALRLCEGLGTKQCHHEHKQGRIVIETEDLPQAAICYGWRVLKEAFQNVLEREYTGPDERYEAHARGNCPHCQADE